MKTYKLEINKKEIDHISLACELFMDQLKDDSMFENSNAKDFYEVWDIRNKLKKLL